MKKNLILAIVTVAVVAGAVMLDRLYMKRAAARSAAKPASKSDGFTPAPDITLKDLDGKDVSLAQFRGKVVLVNFWATWCGPCEKEIPWMIEFQQKYAARGFTMLGLAMDEEGKQVVAPWVQKMKFDVNGTKMGMNYPILLANDDAADKFGGLIGLPSSFLISRDGKILKKFIGLVSYEHYAKAIEENL